MFNNVGDNGLRGHFSTHPACGICAVSGAALHVSGPVWLGMGSTHDSLSSASRTSAGCEVVE